MTRYEQLVARIERVENELRELKARKRALDRKNTPRKPYKRRRKNQESATENRRCLQHGNFGFCRPCWDS